MALNVCIYRYTDQASDLWDLFHGKSDVPLFQVQIAHEAQRSITYQMKESFNDFLSSAKDADDTMPATVQELETAAGVKLIVSDRTGFRFFTFTSETHQKNQIEFHFDFQ